MQRPCGEREHEKGKLQSKGIEGQERRDQVKLGCKMKQERKGGPGSCRTLQAELRSQQVTFTLKILKSFEYFKQ